MTLDDVIHPVIDFVRHNETWAMPVVFALAFGESLAFISLLLPATIALVGIGALIGASGIDFIPIWLAGAVGAALGDWVSYWVGATFKTTVADMWPFSRRPDLIPWGEVFVRRWGVLSVFIGRFFGPARASVPLVAGIFAMPFLPFQIANVISALVWAGALLAPGTFGMRFLM